MARVGAMKDVKDIDAETTTLANSIKASVEEKAGKTFSVYEPVKYATQVYTALIKAITLVMALNWYSFLTTYNIARRWS